MQLYSIGKEIFGEKFVGVYPADTFVKKISKTMSQGEKAIVNTDNSDGKGIHWILAIKHNKRPNEFLFYDSYGKDVKLYNPYFRELKITQDKSDREQQFLPKESNCGQRALASGMVYSKLGKGAFLKI